MLALLLFSNMDSAPQKSHFLYFLALKGYNYIVGDQTD